MITLSTLIITPEILSLISRIDEFKGAWKSLSTLAPERLASLKHVATIESIGSSTRIEGSKLTDREVEQLLGKLEIQSFDTRDEQEVAGYADLMELVFESWEHIPITENYIKQLHGILLKFSDKDQWHKGQYKNNSNNVSAVDHTGNVVGIIFETATPFDTPRLMGELIDWYNQSIETKEIHPLLVVAVFTIVFLEIHPFQDGNGRISRILTTLLLLKSGYSYIPYCSLESIIEQNKQGYYLALRQTQQTIRTSTPDWQPWIVYFLKALNSHVTKLEEKVAREKILLSSIPELSLKILDIVKNHGRITMAQAEDLTGANRNTLKVHFRKLVESGFIENVSAGRGSYYIMK